MSLPNETRQRFYANPGSRVKIIYEPFFDDNGARVLRPVGKEDLNAYIQSFKEQTDINVIIKRFELGDVSALNARSCTYGDFTNAPKTLADFLNAQITADRLFSELPVDVRNKFDNDVNKFFLGYGSPEWIETISPFLKKNDVVKEEVKE